MMKTLESHIQIITDWKCLDQEFILFFFYKKRKQFFFLKFYQSKMMQKFNKKNLGEGKESLCEIFK